MRRKIELVGLLAVLLVASLVIPACTCNISDGNVYYDCYGNIVPCANSTYSLGSATTYWDNIYVNNIFGAGAGGTGNVTSTGTASHIPYFQTNTNLANSSIYYKILNGYIGIFNNNPLYHLDVTGQIHSTGDIDSDSDINAGNDLNCINDLDVGDDANVGGNLDVIGNITVGGTVDGVDVADHDARHEWGGADEISIRDLLFGLPPLWFREHSSTTGFTTTTTGTASVNVGMMSSNMQTGATSGSQAGYYTAVSHYIATTSANYRFRFQSRFQAYTGTSDLEFWCGFVPSTFPTLTGNHVAFRMVYDAAGNTYLYATNANGAAQTQTTIYSGFAATQTIDVYFKYMSADIKYYYSTDGGATWNLGATHTTNRPTATTVRTGYWLTNTAAADKRVYFYPMKILQGDE